MFDTDKMLCATTGEWTLIDDKIAYIGLTDIAVETLGDIVFIELPETGSYYSKDEIFATIESVKMAQELYIPIAGEVIEVNEKLINSPELINENCFENWLIKIKPDNFKEDSSDLLEYNDYKDNVG